MNLDQILAAITPQAYENLKFAVETGRWPNGDNLTPEQREHCLQAIIAYDIKHHETPDRVGYIDNSKKKRASKETDEWQNLPISNPSNRGA